MWNILISLLLMAYEAKATRAKSTRRKSSKKRETKITRGDGAALFAKAYGLADLQKPK